ncbi:hypothetical protein, partial [Lapidilactobacillus wuchangensis]|uniref:hypothetical protein n=1 Tax=Lapidilactobacillus wuchangensis TaxID=2486001 RepID=UPI001CDD7680
QLQTEWRDLVVSRQIIVSALALTIRPVLETFEKRLQSVSAAFHDKQPAMQSDSVLFQHHY